MSGKLATVVAIGLGMIAYFIMLFKTRTLTDEDYAMMPGGSKLKKLNDKFFK